MQMIVTKGNDNRLHEGIEREKLTLLIDVKASK